MKIALNSAESEEYFYNSLCNGLGYLGQYGIELSYDENKYKSSRKKLESPCYEDVLMQMLRDGHALTFTDTECGMDQVSVTLADVHKKVSLTEPRHLIDMSEGQDDADTADVILQTVIYGEVVFG